MYFYNIDNFLTVRLAGIEFLSCVSIVKGASRNEWTREQTH